MNEANQRIWDRFINILAQENDYKNNVISNEIGKITFQFKDEHLDESILIERLNEILKNEIEKAKRENLCLSFEHCNLTQDKWNYFLTEVKNWGDPIVNVSSSLIGTVELTLNSELVDQKELWNILEVIINKMVFPDRKSGLNTIIENAANHQNDTISKLTYERNDRELPIKLIKDITTSCGHVFRLSAILSNQNLYPWYYENFIELFMVGTRKIRAKFITNYNDILDQTWLETDIISYEVDIIDYIKCKISEGYYFAIRFDEYYIPNKLCYKKHHYIHDVLVYGYNDFKNELNTVSYYGLHGYLKVSIDYKTFTEAYVKGKMFKQSGTNRYMCHFKTKDIEHYKFSMEKYVRSLENYINSVNILTLNNPEVYSFKNPEAYNKLSEQQKQIIKYGLEVYDVIINSLEYKYENISNVNYYITFLVLTEHKKSVYRSLSYIKSEYCFNEKFGELLVEYNNLAQTFENLERKYVKQSLQESNNTNYKGPIKDHIFNKYIIDTLKSVRQNEYEILSQVLLKLKAGSI